MKRICADLQEIFLKISANPLNLCHPCSNLEPFLDDITNVLEIILAYLRLLNDNQSCKGINPLRNSLKAYRISASNFFRDAYPVSCSASGSDLRL